VRVRISLATAVADELDGGQKQSEEAGGQATDCEHQREPTEVGVGTMVGDAAETDEDQCGGDDSCAKDEKAGAKKLAGVWLHGHQRIEACMM
jgi:hypothetical protein